MNAPHSFMLFGVFLTFFDLIIFNVSFNLFLEGVSFYFLLDSLSHTLVIPEFLILIYSLHQVHEDNAIA